MTTDPRILNPKTLARYKADLEYYADAPIIGALIEHSEALAEQVDTLSRQKENWESVARKHQEYIASLTDEDGTKS